MLDHLLTLERPLRDVRTRFVESTHRLDEHASLAVERAWQEKLADPEVKLFDGPMCRFEGAAVEPGGDVVTLQLSRTSYRVFLGTNLFGDPSLPDRALANPIGVSPALETADGLLAFGVRNASVAYYPHRLHPFSGALEPPAGNGDLDVFAECRRELAEEIGLVGDDVTEVSLLGIVRDAAIRHPELILLARTSLSSNELAGRLRDEEHAAIVLVDGRSNPAESSDVEPTPVARATLELYRKLVAGA